MNPKLEEFKLQLVFTSEVLWGRQCYVTFPGRRLCLQACSTPHPDNVKGDCDFTEGSLRHPYHGLTSIYFCVWTKTGLTHNLILKCCCYWLKPQCEHEHVETQRKISVLFTHKSSFSKSDRSNVQWEKSRNYSSQCFQDILHIWIWIEIAFVI